jgi:D-alanyl-D-alanine carboxypeptidase
VKLEHRMVASREAAQQPKAKLFIAAGASISVEDAIKALVTRSANDVAVIVAEHLGGTEERFASKMTAKARELGMSRTRFLNASGLPNPAQQTTARDMATLSQALLEDFPQFYGYFQTPSIKWGREYARNHNNLLGKVEGVDGIKTGYTIASGFNLASSVMRDGQRIIAVVMGGETALARDNQMRYLIEQSFQTLLARGPNAARLASLPLERSAFDTPATGAAAERTADDQEEAQGSATGEDDALSRAAELLREAEAESTGD